MVKFLDTIKKLEVVLYVDNREVKNQKERNYVYDKIAAAGINCKSVPLPVGDFLWVVNIEGITNSIFDKFTRNSMQSDLYS